MLTSRSVDDVLATFEKTCGGLTWKVFEESRDSVEGVTVQSYIARSSIHFQSLKLEIVDDPEVGSLILLVHPLFLHAVKLSGFVRLPILADSVVNRIQRFVRGIKKLDPKVEIRYRTLWKGFLTTAGPPDAGDLDDLIVAFES